MRDWIRAVCTAMILAGLWIIFVPKPESLDVMTLANVTLKEELVENKLVVDSYYCEPVTDIAKFSYNIIGNTVLNSGITTLPNASGDPITCSELREIGKAKLQALLNTP